MSRPPSPADQAEDWLEVFDDAGRLRGLARRGDCHGNPALIHRTVHVVVVGRDGRLLLQKRPMHKDTQPGKWDTAVGGHVDPGEDYEHAARREMSEELGIPPDLPLEYLCDRKIRNDFESEDVRLFAVRYDGPFRPDPGEIDGVRFWDSAQLARTLGAGVFTPSLEDEIRLLRKRFPVWLAPLSPKSSTKR
ncbi:MAG: NUDIX domain-containing protein [Kiritimatiellaeota bacterium]|nr:NUDIX domain-containing protein [Kiritimatiellota bacterium]